jgi:hypothetical protein
MSGAGGSARGVEPVSPEERASGYALLMAAQEELHCIQRGALAKTPIDHAAILDAHRRYSDLIREVIR